MIYNPDSSNLLQETKFVVEADSFAQLTLWREYAKDSTRKTDLNTLTWEQINPGSMRTIGFIKKKPVSIELTWARINGHIIMFYNACSQMVDHKMVEDWLDQNCNPIYDHGRQARTDAMNFHAIRSVVE